MPIKTRSEHLKLKEKEKTSIETLETTCRLLYHKDSINRHVADVSIMNGEATRSHSKCPISWACLMHGALLKDTGSAVHINLY